MTTSTIPQFNHTNLSALVADGKIFSVEFIKRSTGELRKMTCRMGVKKHLKGGNKSYSAKAKNLLTVYSLDSAGYRSIPVETIRKLTVSGQTFSFTQLPNPVDQISRASLSSSPTGAMLKILLLR